MSSTPSKSPEQQAAALGMSVEDFTEYNYYATSMDFFVSPPLPSPLLSSHLGRLIH